VRARDTQSQEPKGRRTIRPTRYGWAGYIGREKWMTFESENRAIEWRDTKTV